MINRSCPGQRQLQERHYGQGREVGQHGLHPGDVGHADQVILGTAVLLELQTSSQRFHGEGPYKALICLA